MDRLFCCRAPRGKLRRLCPLRRLYRLSLDAGRATQQLVQLIGEISGGVEAQGHSACEPPVDGFRNLDSWLPQARQVRHRLRLEKSKVDEDYAGSPLHSREVGENRLVRMLYRLQPYGQGNRLGGRLILFGNFSVRPRLHVLQRILIIGH